MLSSTTCRLPVIFAQNAAKLAASYSSLLLFSDLDLEVGPRVFCEFMDLCQEACLLKIVEIVDLKKGKR